MKTSERRVIVEYLVIIFALLVWAAMLTFLNGCTRIVYKNDGSITYTSVLQRKQFSVQREAAGVWRATYNTDSEAAVELARTVERLAGLIEKGAAK